MPTTPGTRKPSCLPISSMTRASTSRRKPHDPGDLQRPAPEEHNPKLVYVLRRWWQHTGGRTIYRAGAGQFTATPELPPSFEEPPTE